MLEDKAGNLWLGHNSENMKNGGEGGVWRYDGSMFQNQFTNLKQQNHEQKTFKCSIIVNWSYNFWIING